MANSKISALPAASTPLAGTELVPIVQGGITEQVSVANLTAGRAVGALSLSTTQGITGGSLYSVSGFSGYRASGASISSPGDAAMYFNSATGQTLQARAGSSYDWSLINPGNANYIAQVPTGTLDFRLAGGNFIMGTAAKGINFTANTPAAGMTSQLLNWYEEGTWTPNQGAGLVVVGTFSSSGSYTRVGRVVTANFRLLATTSLSATGVVALTSNLPFSVRADSIGAFGVGTNATGAVTFNFQVSGTTAFLEGSNIAATTAIYGSVTYMAA